MPTAYNITTKHVVRGTVTPTPWILLEMQSLRPCSRSIDPESAF